MGPDQGARQAARTPGAQDHRPQGRAIRAAKAESEPTLSVPTNEDKPHDGREEPNPSQPACFGEE